MKPIPIILRTPNAFQKWSEGRRTLVWEMIEKLGKGEVSHKEARGILREEKKALAAISKQMLGFKAARTWPVNMARPMSAVPKTPKIRQEETPRSSLPSAGP